MSTKIYHAYKLSKKQDILLFFDRMKEVCDARVSADDKYLYLIHAISLTEALKTVEKNPDNWHAKRMIECDEKGDIDSYWITTVLKEKQRSQTREAIDMYFTCSVFPAKGFWYLKFYPNAKWMMDVLSQIEKEFKEVLFDYHYQNQTDPPKNMTYKSFNKRLKDWDKVMGDNGDFTRGMIMEIYTPNSFEKLISLNYYQGKKTSEELYSQLAYKFDKKIEEKPINN